MNNIVDAQDFAPLDFVPQDLAAPQFLLAQAEEHIEQGNFDEAEQLANEALQHVPLKKGEAAELQRYNLRGSAFISLCRIAFRRGDFQTSLALASSALEIAQEKNLVELEAKAFNAIGSVHQKFLDFDNAITNLFNALAINEKLGNKEETARTLSNIGSVYSGLSDSAKALAYYYTALESYEELGNSYGIATVYANIGHVYFKLSDYASALEFHQKSLALNEEIGNRNGVAGDLNNIGIVYDELRAAEKALEYFQRAIEINEETGNKAWLAVALANVGLVYSALADYTQTFAYLHKSLAISEELGYQDLTAGTLANIGWNMYLNRSDYSEALSTMQRALTLYEESGSKEGIARNLGNIGVVYSARTFVGHDPQRAEEFLLKSLTMGREIGNKKIEYEAHQWLAELYKDNKRWEEAFEHLEHFITIEKQVLSDQVRSSATFLDQRRQADEHAKKLAVTKATADAEMKVTTTLLHKVLPSSIANRLIKGEKVADYFAQVSILFADIVGFTTIASRMPAKSVLAFLNYVFGEFDSIMERHQCEKIKTIGDGYLAVAGAPVLCEDHAERITRAALEMMGDIVLPEEIRATLPRGSQFNLRIGIHTGPCFGGIVGENRFVYDIYSDAVNLAARMESHGEAGKIHVSDEFCFHLQNRMDATGEDFGGIRFDEREEMEIKGKGMMRTYFLERS